MGITTTDAKCEMKGGNMVERKLGMPGVEFEGPLGQFWSMKEVPFEAMIAGIAEILQELSRRGYKEEIILEALKREPKKVDVEW